MKYCKILPNQTIKASFNLIKKNGIKGLVVTDTNNKLLGTLSDGDLRTSLLKDFNLDNKITKIFNKNPDYLIVGEYSKQDTYNLINVKGLTFIPIVNKDSFKLVDILTLKKIEGYQKKTKSKLLSKIPCVIMAGGKGTRLKPFTDVLPKPLLPIQNKTVIEKIIHSFVNYGLNNFTISVNYKAVILKAFFKELNPKYSIKFLQEKKPLGTAGCLSKLKKINSKDIFISNCDVIIDINLNNMFIHHKENNFDITILTSTSSYQIPYGVCKISKDGVFKEINEKPKVEFLTNIGVYLIKKNILTLIPKNKNFDFTDLIKLAKKRNKKIGVFSSHKNSWLDVGQWSEFTKTIQKF